MESYNPSENTVSQLLVAKQHNAALIFCGGPLHFAGCVQRHRSESQRDSQLKFEGNYFQILDLKKLRSLSPLPSDRRLSAKLAPTFAGRGCHVVSAAIPTAVLSVS
jgi:hypothetical protein